MPHPDTDTRPVRLFRNNRNQAVRIPVEFELPGNEATIRRVGNRLIIEPVGKTGLLDMLATWEPLDVDFPDTDAGLPPLDDVHL